MLRCKLRLFVARITTLSRNKFCVAKVRSDVYFLQHENLSRGEVVIGPYKWCFKYRKPTSRSVYSLIRSVKCISLVGLRAFLCWFTSRLVRFSPSVGWNGLSIRTVRTGRNITGVFSPLTVRELHLININVRAGLSRPWFCACSLFAPASPRKAFLVPFCPSCLLECSTNQNPPIAHIFEGLRGVLEGKTSCHSPRRSHFTQNGCRALHAWIFKMAISHSRKERLPFET